MAFGIGIHIYSYLVFVLIKLKDSTLSDFNAVTSIWKSAKQLLVNLKTNNTYQNNWHKDNINITINSQTPDLIAAIWCRW